ncbi:MAG: MFS transporter [Alphaproteobacteria bacterium]|nr:MFS transporter [Alphaproteobacteria bacterium]
MTSLFLIVLVDLIGFGIIIPLLPFFAEHFGATPLQVGLVMAAYSLAQLIAAPMWGRLSDRIGRRPVLLGTLVGMTIGSVGLAYTDSLEALFIVRIATGFMAGNISTAFAYAADISTPETRARGMGIVGAAFGLGFIAGPAIGGILAGPDPLAADFRTPALAAAGLSFLAMVLAILRLPESLPPEARAAARAKKGPPFAVWRDAVHRPSLRRLIVLMFCATFVFAGMEATFTMWSQRQFGWGPEPNGYLFAMIGLLSATIQGGLIGRLADRFGEERLVAAGAAFLAAGLALIPLATAPALLIPAMLLAGTGFSLLSPALNSLISFEAAETERGVIMGLSRSAATLGRVLGPAWGGVVFGMIGKDAPYVLGAVLMLAYVFAALRLLRGRQKRN